MSKEPLITRSELRRRKEQTEELTVRQQKLQTKKAEKDYSRKEKEIANFYRKENKKNKPVTKTRTGEQQKSRELNGILVKSIIVVSLLIVIVMLATFFL